MNTVLVDKLPGVFPPENSVRKGGRGESPELEPGLSEIQQSRLDLAHTRTDRMRQLEKQSTGIWSEMAELAVLVDEQKDWELLGYRSFGAWMKENCPQSRSMVYMGMAAFKELQEIPVSELKQIPLGNAEILAQAPRSIRSTPKLLDAAKVQQPRDFRSTVIQSAPDSHLETIVRKRFKFTVSQLQTVDAALEMYGIINEDEAGEGTRLEAICAEFLQIHKQEWEAKRV